MHPLAKSAGGDPFHAGGKHWQSKNDAEWQTLAAWVKTGARRRKPRRRPTDSTSKPTARNRADLPEGTRPGRRRGHVRQLSLAHFDTPAVAALVRRREAWTEAQSRQNFDAVKRAVDSGDPAKSPLAIHPLAAAVGGDQQHTGGKFWTTPDNPEYLAVVAWVKSATPAADGAAPVARYRWTTRSSRRGYSPIFLAKRPGHARCITCHETGNPRLTELEPGAAPTTRNNRAGTSRRGSGWCSWRPGGEPAADAPALQDGRRRPVPCRRQALAVEVGSGVADAGRLGSR